MENITDIDWSKQHSGVIKASFDQLKELMPDVFYLIERTFPDDPYLFTWDVKVHMLMPKQYPCIPNWHQDAVPRDCGIQKFDQINTGFPLYLWVSGAPLPEFEGGFLLPKQWFRFTQADVHRGCAASEFCWRGLIRAIHSKLVPPKKVGALRRHSQVYLDAENYKC